MAADPQSSTLLNQRPQQLDTIFSERFLPIPRPSSV